jgi:splicing factor 3B subunit 4
MSANKNRTVYIGNLDEKVSDKVLYDILIQAGRVQDLHIPRDRETDKPKGFAFAEYETDEIADYAVKLFSGLVTLYNRTLKFGISGQDKASQNISTPSTLASNLSYKTRSQPMPINNVETSYHSMRLSASCRVSAYPADNSEEPAPPGVTHHQNGHGSHYNGDNYEYSRRVLGAKFDSFSRSRSRHFDTSNPVPYPY